MELQKMRRMAKELVRALAQRAEPGVGFTVIVHTPKPAKGEWPMALETTLESRQQYRALLAEAVTVSVLMDGGNVDSVGEIAADDYNSVMRRRRSGV